MKAIAAALIALFLVASPIVAQSSLEADMRDCPACLSQIPLAARRCAFCTEEVGPAAAATAP